jgi:hypothetical protein
MGYMLCKTPRLHPYSRRGVRVTSRRDLMALARRAGALRRLSLRPGWRPGPVNTSSLCPWSMSAVGALQHEVQRIDDSPAEA